MQTIAIDITEFVNNPIRTGIQRIVREIFCHWPTGIRCTAIAFDREKKLFYRVPHRLLRFGLQLADREGISYKVIAAEIARLDPPEDRRLFVLETGQTVLVPELFFDSARVAAHTLAKASGVHFFYVVPDFLVWLDPTRFDLVGTATFMPYLELLVRADHRAFISQAVQDVFERRILRRPCGASGISIPLGADSLGVEKQAFSAKKNEYLCIGSLDGRKGQEKVFEAFSRLALNVQYSLTFIGRVFERAPPQLAGLLTSTTPNIKVVTDASDATIAAHLRRARATLYVSEAEGYGLPPMESLAAGVPVVVHRDLPALQGRSADGQIRLESCSVGAIESAFARLADDNEARGLWEGAATFPTQTWLQYARQIAGWATAA